MIKRSSKSISFLMEFIIVILFFALSSAVCVHLYASAKSNNDTANNTKTALLIAQNHIALVKDLKTPLTKVSYDEKGNVNSKGEYLVESEETKDKKQLVRVYYKEKVLVELPYVILEVANEK